MLVVGGALMIAGFVIGGIGALALVFIGGVVLGVGVAAGL